MIQCLTLLTMLLTMKTKHDIHRHKNSNRVDNCIPHIICDIYNNY